MKKQKKQKKFDGRITYFQAQTKDGELFDGWVSKESFVRIKLNRRKNRWEIYEKTK